MIVYTSKDKRDVTRGYFYFLELATARIVCLCTNPNPSVARGVGNGRVVSFCNEKCVAAILHLLLQGIFGVFGIC